MTNIHTATVTEFAPKAEQVTGHINVRLATGESFADPIVFGYYPDSTELWIEQEGRRVQFQAEVLQAVVKQMRRGGQFVRRRARHATGSPAAARPSPRRSRARYGGRSRR